MKQYVQFFPLTLLFVLTMIAGCADNPDDDIIISKNDGAFDAALVQTATAPAGPQEIMVDECFNSTDGSVEFTMRLDETIIPSAVPVVEVAPHYLTGEDAKRVSQVLFGEDALFYEKEPMLGPLEETMTRADVLDAIQRWSQYTSQEALVELGAQNMGVSVERIKNAIDKYTELYEQIPENRSYESAKWTMQADAYYAFTEKQIEADGSSLDDCNDEIQVTTYVDGMRYEIQFASRNRDDFRLNQIYAFPSTQWSPGNIDSMIYRAMLCRTEKPTEEQIANIGVKAQKMLDDMELGQWKVDQCYLSTQYSGDIAEYRIVVTAVPVLQGISVIRRPQLSNLKSENTYASNYYLTDVLFKFSAEGRLVFLEMSSPIEVKEVLNDNVATMTMDELVQRAKDHLSLSDKEAYGIEGELLDVMERGAGEDFVCKIELCEMEYGMFRVKVPNMDDSYYYVPGALFHGTVDYCGAETGEIYFSSGTDIGEERVMPLLALNAVDGSVIELYN